MVFFIHNAKGKFRFTKTLYTYPVSQSIKHTFSLFLDSNVNHVPIKRALTTTSTAIFVPFTTQELFMAGELLYYGLNALSSNMIMVDRKKLKNPNGLILGTPGSGKSFAAKREITNAYFVTNDNIIIGDP